MRTISYHRLALIVATVLLTCCSDPQVDVVIAFEDEQNLDEAWGVEVYLLERCYDSGELEEELQNAEKTVHFRVGDDDPDLGPVQPGSHGLAARVRNGFCEVIASGCTNFELDERKEETIRVRVSPLEELGPACLEGEGSCVNGLCELTCPAEPGWTRSWSGRTEGLDLAIGPDGRIAAGGVFTGTVDFDPGLEGQKLTAVYEKAVMVVLFDESGELQWVRAIDGDGYLEMTGFDFLADGTLVVAGNFSNVIDLDPGPDVVEQPAARPGDFDSFVFAFEPSGEPRWVRTLSGLDEVKIMDLSSDGSRVFALGGYFEGSVDFDPSENDETRISTDARDGFVMLMDGEGDLVWVDILEGDSDQRVLSVALSKEFMSPEPWAIVATGGFSGMTDFDPGAETSPQLPEGADDVFVVRLLPDGNYDWSRFIQGEDLIEAFDVAIAPGDDIVVMGTFDGVADLDPGPDEDLRGAPLGNTSSGHWLIRLNARGKRNWVHSWEDFAGSIVGQCVVTTVDSSVLFVSTLVGEFDLDPGLRVEVHDSSGVPQGLIQHLDSEGGFVQYRVFDEGTSVWLLAAASAEGWMVLGGDFGPPYDFDPGPCIDEHSVPGSVGTFVTRLESNFAYGW